MMNKFVKEHWLFSVVVIAVSTAYAYGVSDYLIFSKAVSLILPVVAGLFYLLDKTLPPDTSDRDVQIDILGATVEQQTEILDEYERIFDSQLVELPCICGGNTFQGLFSPKTENIVTCNKCNNNYRVDIQYEAVLISEPLNVEKTFNELVGEI